MSVGISHEESAFLSATRSLFRLLLIAFIKPGHEVRTPGRHRAFEENHRSRERQRIALVQRGLALHPIRTVAAVQHCIARGFPMIYARVSSRKINLIVV